ncbi:MAG: hypothetical protein ACTJGH_00410 [Peptoniphilaceae bacterium]
MMAGIKYYRSIIQEIINQDKNTFQVTRSIKEDDGFGGTIESTKQIEFEGRIYNRKSIREITEIKGISLGFTQTTTEKLLTLSDVDIKKGDVFEFKDRTLRVKFVNDYFGICKQTELEAIRDE